MIQMRPQFHHIDASTELERQSRAREAGALNPRAPGEAKAIHMTIKSVGEDDDNSENMAERIRAAQDEKWRKLNYIDEENPEAWQIFEDDMLIHGQDSKEAEEDGVVGKIAKLVSGMGDAEYLDAISAPRDAARLSRNRMEVKGKGNGQHAEEDSGSESG